MSYTVRVCVRTRLCASAKIYLSSCINKWCITGRGDSQLAIGEIFVMTKYSSLPVKYICN